MKELWWALDIQPGSTHYGPTSIWLQSGFPCEPIFMKSSKDLKTRSILVLDVGRTEVDACYSSVWPCSATQAAEGHCLLSGGSQELWVFPVIIA